MAGFADFYTGGGMSQNPLAFSLAGINDKMDDLNTDRGLSQQQSALQFGRATTQMVNDYDSKGTFQGGQAGVAGDQMRADYDYGNHMTSMMTDRALANQVRNKTLAAYGVMF
jgi:hypothetical protein